MYLSRYDAIGLASTMPATPLYWSYVPFWQRGDADLDGGLSGDN